ncbi:MAG TPA: wax ester/triacylglycerol synthase family O-acyltransferase [Nocardioidaceae bacterium]|nr:wax ester/triacylglycerol synthase family O-acyltransferase [Nocardioidaceae bacterium]
MSNHTSGVERMKGVDAGYLYMETPTMHMHTLKIALLEPVETVDYRDITGQLLARLHRLPPFQRRVLPVPFALNHPMWVTDRPIDPTRHVFHDQVPAPGGMAGLEALVGRIASTPLDRSIPLWEVHVCEAFDDGRVAVVAKMHHAIADGVAANALLANIIDSTDSSATRLEPSGQQSASGTEPTPAARTQVGLALLDAIRQLGTLPELLGRTFRALVALVRHRRHSRVKVPRPVLDVPRVSFNGPLSSRRIFATGALPLNEIKEVQHAHGVTFNDVVLAVVAGALRKWMTGRGEWPSAPLVAGVPVATDEPGAPQRLSGNRVSNLFTSLATDIDDPHERLRAISATTNESKAVQRTLGHDMLVDWVQFSPPAPLSAAMRIYSKTRAASLHPPPFNVIVSNVRGPGAPATISGARLSDLFSVGPILEGIGLNVTAWSYVGQMNFSLLSCPDLISDLGPLVAELRPALDELRKTEG